MHPPFISLVIPCFNEEKRVNAMLLALEQFQKRWPHSLEIIVVDDGSTDKSISLLETQAGNLPLQLLTQHNTGKGGALQRGVAAARGEYILTLDADMATPPEELLTWMELRSWDKQTILIGSREINRTKVKDKPLREFIGRLFNQIIRLLTGLAIRDTQCGFKLYPRAIGQELFHALQTLGWAHDVELLVRAKKKNISVVEMPVQWKAVEGSKIRVLRDSWTMFWEVVRIRGIR